MDATTALLGITYCIVSLVLFLLNGFLLKALLKDSEYKTSTYRIIKNMCVSCMFQLIPFFVGGLMTLWDTVFDYYLDRVLGVVIQSGWFLYLALSLTLAIDRLVIFALPQKHIFKDKLANYLLIASWLFWLINVIILCLPGFGFTFASKQHYLVMWINTNGDGSVIMATIEAYFDLIILAIIFFIYLTVFGYLVKMRLSSSVSVWPIMVEIKIFLVAVISFGYETLFIIYSFWVPPVPEYQKFVDICVNLAWILDCGLFTIVTLIINQSLRRKVLELLGAKKRNDSVITLA